MIAQGEVIRERSAHAADAPVLTVHLDLAEADFLTRTRDYRRVSIQIGRLTLDRHPQHCLDVRRDLAYLVLGIGPPGLDPPVVGTVSRDRVRGHGEILPAAPNRCTTARHRRTCPCRNGYRRLQTDN